MAEVVDIWEAFQQDISTGIRLSDSLNTAVKPISKLYELWCLGNLIEILEEITGKPPKALEISQIYRFGEGLTLHYNSSLGGLGNYFKNNLDINGPGKPDFAIEFDKEIVWVGDAKFKTNIKKSDYQRFISYIIDLLPPERTSTLLYVNPNPVRKRYVRDYPIDHVSLRPDYEDSLDVLAQTLSQILDEVNAV
jgi:hypothetical protein